MRTFGGEHPRDRKPDSPACAGDERDTAFQLQFHLPGFLDPSHGHVAIARQRVAVVVVRRTRGLQDVLSAISGLLQPPDRRRQLGRAGAERHRRPAAQAVLDMHVENARGIGRKFLRRNHVRARRCFRYRS